MGGVIGIVATGKCEGCPFMDLEGVSLCSAGAPVCRAFRCTRKPLCDRLESYLRQKIEGKIEEG